MNASKTKLLVTVAAISLLATAFAACCGFYLARIALEQRLLQAQSQNLATVVTSLRLPLTQRLLQNLKQVSNCEVVITRQGKVVSATLPLPRGADFRHSDHDSQVIGDMDYRLAEQPLDDGIALWLLLPSSVFNQGLNTLTEPIAILAIITATLALIVSVASANAYASLTARNREADRRLAKAQHAALAGKLSASVVHELRNPLSGIKMNAQLLAEELPPGTDATEPLDMIIHEIDRIDQFLRGLTAVPEKDITPSQQDTVAHVLASALQLMERKAQKKRIRLTLDDHTAPTDLAPCNPMHLRQILVNLIANAMDASPQDSTIAVSASQSPLTLTVTDQGTGVHPKDGEDIFAPFVSQKENGFGLGLHISQEIAAKYSATISWKNLPDAGAQFTLAFPD